MEDNSIAVVTGASSGIGAATAEALARAGFAVVLGARRLDRLSTLVCRIGGGAAYLDVADAGSVEEFASRLESVAVLVNNAGGALGLEPIAEADDERWLRMYATNVLGTVRMTRALLPALGRSGRGHVVNIGSIAGFEVYAGGAGYTAAKHALSAVTETLRLELLGSPIRVTQIDPGMVETEFSIVRFDGDAERAARTYAGMTPLQAGDIADAVVWAVTRPPHVNVDHIVLRPLDQATATQVHRRS
ncbi:MAG: SDR family NAD(P)-dependent oxidoreductase [Capsulimonadaceae bacterium]